MLKTIALLLPLICSAYSVVTLFNANDLKKFAASADVAVIGYFETLDSVKANVFRDLVTQIPDLQSGITVEKSVKKLLKLDGEGVILFKNFDEGKSVFEDEFTSEALRFWIQANRRPLVGHYSEKARSRLFGGEITTHIVLFSKDQFDFARINRQFKAAAKQFKGKIGFVYVDTDIDDSDPIIDFFGLTQNDFPTLRIVSFEKEILTIYKPDFTGFSGLSTENIVSFAQSYLSGSLVASLPKKNKNWQKVFGKSKHLTHIEL